MNPQCASRRTSADGRTEFTPLDRDLRSHFDHPPGRDLEIVGGVVGRAAEADEQQVLPARHAPMGGGPERGGTVAEARGKAASIASGR